MLAHQKEALVQQLALLVEYDEPAAVLATLKRIAERRAHSATRGQIGWDEAARWVTLAEALERVEKHLDRPPGL
jgi:hypothetical protein